MPRVTIDREVTESAPLGLVLLQPFMQRVTGPEEIGPVHYGRTPGRPYGWRGVLRDGLLDGFQIALVGHGISLGWQVFGIGGPYWIEIEHYESIESALLRDFLHAGHGRVEFLLGGSAGIEPDGDERTLSDRAQGVAPLVVVLGVVDLVHSAFQVRDFCVCPIRPGVGIRLFCTTYTGA